LVERLAAEDKDLAIRHRNRLRMVDQMEGVDDHVVAPNTAGTHEVPILDDHPPAQYVELADGGALLCDQGAYLEVLGDMSIELARFTRVGQMLEVPDPLEPVLVGGEGHAPLHQRRHLLEQVGVVVDLSHVPRHLKVVAQLFA